MNKGKNILLSCFYAFAFLCLSFLPACTSNTYGVEEGEKGQLFVTLRSLSGFEDENRINTIRFLVFHGDILEANRLFDFDNYDGFVVDGANQFPFFSVGYLATGPKQILVVANETPDMTTQLNALTEIVTRIDDVLAIHTGLGNTPFNLFDDNGVMRDDVFLPMTGRGAGTVERNEGGPNSSTVIHLTHMTAKIEISLRKVAEYAIEINEIRLENNLNRSLLWNASGTANILGQSSYDIISTGAHFMNDFVSFPPPTNQSPFTFPAIGEPGAAGVLHVLPIFVFENLIGNRAGATMLEIDAVLRDIDEFGVVVAELPVTFWVPVNGRITPDPNTHPDEGDPIISDPDSDDYRIRRGHHYRINGTILGKEISHISVKVEILPWQVGNNSQKVLQ